MVFGQDLPYHSIESYPEDHTAANMIARMIDGLGYRYYWATEGLTDEDLIFRPSEDASSLVETVDHIHDLAIMIHNAVHILPNVRPIEKQEISYEEMRAETLNMLYDLSQALRSKNDSQVNDMKLIFQRGDQESTFEIWHLINGPIADAIYHTGQIVSFRRTNGNPISPKVNVFMGKNRK